MPLRPLLRACVGFAFLAAAPRLAAQLAPSSPTGADVGVSMVAGSAAPSADPFAAVSAVEMAAAAAGVPLIDPVPAIDGFAAWLPDAVDRVVEDALARGAAPGAAVVIGHRGKIVLA